MTPNFHSQFFAPKTKQASLLITHYIHQPSDQFAKHHCNIHPLLKPNCRTRSIKNPKQSTENSLYDDDNSRRPSGAGNYFLYPPIPRVWRGFASPSPQQQDA
eukprot:scaffold48_cov161-Amphora_coffeaeformis.AAC.28